MKILYSITLPAYKKSECKNVGILMYIKKEVIVGLLSFRCSFIGVLGICLLSFVMISRSTALGKESYTITKTIRIAPGESYLFYWDAKKGALNEMVVFDPKSLLPSETIAQIERVPHWVKEDLLLRMVDLGKVPVDVGAHSVPCFGDVNGDGITDLVVGCQDGTIRCYLAPGWKEDSSIFARIDVGENASPTLFDYNRDGRLDLLVGNSLGKLHLFVAPDWKDISYRIKGLTVTGQAKPLVTDINNDGLPELLVGCKDGSVTIFSASGWNKRKVLHLLPSGMKNSQVRVYDLNQDGKLDLIVRGESGPFFAYLGPKFQKQIPFIEHLNLDEVAGFAFGDVDNDKRADLLLGFEDGSLSFYHNYGSNYSPKYLVYETQPIHTFRMDVGYSNRPAFADLNGDGLLDLVVGNKEGALLYFLAPNFDKGEALLPSIKLPPYVTPAFADLNDDGVVDLVIGNKEGTLDCFLGPNWRRDTTQFEDIDVGEYSAPAIGDLDDDNKLELLVGNLDGEVFLFSLINGKVEHKGKITSIAVQHSACPCIGDVNDDKIPDILVGNQAGELHLYLGPDFKKEETLFADFDVGEFATPVLADINNDGVDELIVGNLDGELLLYFKGQGTFVEQYSWNFSPGGTITSIEEYYEKYFPERVTLLGFNDLEAVKDITSLLGRTDSPYLDELAFSIAHLPTEVIRTISRLGESEILLENVQSIYKMSKEIKYAKILEKDNYTTLSYLLEDGTEKEMPKEIYYWWVVHPRLIYEVPAKIDVSYWEKPPEYYGQDRLSWLKHEPKPDIYQPGINAVFWRTALPYDDRYGMTLFDAVKNSASLHEAVVNLHNWITWQRPDAFMSFGYATQDIQPMVIFAKAYGSCGEQSILTAACARSMLIPALVVTDRGEDHQWNEYWEDGEWYHWDVNNPAPRGIGNPWVSCEGIDHSGKTVSAVTAWQGNDVMHTVTTRVANPEACNYTSSGRGYTDTGHILIVVQDKNGQPIDGALVVVRSHWEKRNMIATWGYTDLAGECSFDLGYEPYGGYTFEILSPYGTAGTRNFPVQEGQSYRLTYRLQGEKISTSSVLSIDQVRFRPIDIFPKATELEVNFEVLEGVQYPPNFITHTPYRIGRYLTETTGYKGTRWYPQPITTNNEVEMFIVEESELHKFEKNPTSFPLACSKAGAGNCKGIDLNSDKYIVISSTRSERTTLKVKLDFNFISSSASPTISLNPLPKHVFKVGDIVPFRGHVSDNLKVKSLKISLDGGHSFKDINFEGSSGKWKYDWNTSVGGPSFSGKYTVIFKVEDFDGNQVTAEPVRIELLPSTTFLNQILRQDNPESPLPEVSWMLGPFLLNEPERFFEVHTLGKTKGMDLDLFLFYDANENGKIDGMEERVAQSTTPTAKERIYLDFPKSGTYWIYAQGFDVPNDSGTFDIFVSHPYPIRIIRAVEPCGYFNDSLKPITITAHVFSTASVDTASIQLLMDGVDVSSHSLVVDQKVLFTPKTIFDEGSTHKLEFAVKDYAGNSDNQTWSFTIDRSPPTLKVVSPKRGAKIKGKIKLKVKAKDNFKLKSVRYEVNDTISGVLKPVKEKKNLFTAEWKTSSVRNGKHTLVFEAIDEALNKKHIVLPIVVANSKIKE